MQRTGPNLAETAPARHDTRTALAVLVSGGLDSAIYLGEALRERAAVHPLYFREGLSWEATELRHLRRFLEAVRCPALQPFHVLELPVADLYGDHWSVTGTNVPDADSPDEAVFLPGRNVLFLAKAMLWCHLHRVPAVALGSLGTNPFPDATPDFFAAFQDTVNRAVGGKVEVLRPYAGLTKAEVMRRGRGLPLALTYSCIHPVADRHCGSCNKCAERRHAFADAGLPDPTAYQQAVSRPQRPPA
jgi:7-cyano-7-deazaguanine synthase